MTKWRQEELCAWGNEGKTETVIFTFQGFLAGTSELSECSNPGFFRENYKTHQSPGGVKQIRNDSRFFWNFSSNLLQVFLIEKMHPSVTVYADWSDLWIQSSPVFSRPQLCESAYVINCIYSSLLLCVLLHEWNEEQDREAAVCDSPLEYFGPSDEAITHLFREDSGEVTTTWSSGCCSSPVYSPLSWEVSLRDMQPAARSLLKHHGGANLRPEMNSCVEEGGASSKPLGGVSSAWSSSSTLNQEEGFDTCQHWPSS